MTLTKRSFVCAFENEKKVAGRLPKLTSFKILNAIKTTSLLCFSDQLGKAQSKFSHEIIIWVGLLLLTECQPPMSPGSCLKVCGGGGC